MRRYVIWVSFLAIVFGVTACHRDLSVRHLLNHPEQFKKMVRECTAMDEAAARKDHACQVLLPLYEQVMELSEAMDADAPGFGKKIIAVETEINQMRQFLQRDNLSEAKRAAIEQRYHKLQKKLDVMLVLVGKQEGF